MDLKVQSLHSSAVGTANCRQGLCPHGAFMHGATMHRWELQHAYVRQLECLTKVCGTVWCGGRWTATCGSTNAVHLSKRNRCLDGVEAPRTCEINLVEAFGISWIPFCFQIVGKRERVPNAEISSKRRVLVYTILHM